jgi:hypothetical protein
VDKSINTYSFTSLDYCKNFLTFILYTKERRTIITQTREEDDDNSNNWELSVDKEDKMTHTTPKQIEVDSGCCFSIWLC